MITQDQLPILTIPSMNNAHLEEIIIINKLDLAARDERVEEVSQILQELLEHTRIHFFDEEEMMKKVKFQDYAMHKSAHDRHLRELKAIIKYFQEHKDTKAIYAHIEGNLIPWMFHHIETMDATAAKFLK